MNGTPGHPFQGELFLRSLMDTSARIVLAVHVDGYIGYVNQAGQQALGYSADELVGQRVEVLVPTALAERHVQHRTAYGAEPHHRPMGVGPQLTALRKDGSEFPVEIGLTPLPAPNDGWVLTTLNDVTGRLSAAEELRAANRLYRMLAHTNEAFVRARNVDELYAETCRVLVDDGGYPGAWVAQLQPSGDLDLVASAGGLDDHLAQLRITTDTHDPTGQGPISVAVREDRPVYVDDVGSAGLKRAGVAASASLPLRVHGTIVAVLTLYSERPEAFDETTRDQLEGMAENASFGLAGFASAAELDRSAFKSADLLRRLIRAQDDERSRIAADVHDDSVQSLAVVDLRLGLLHRRTVAVAPELTEAVVQLQETVRQVTDGLRRLLFELEATDSGSTLPELVNEAAAVIFEDVDVRWTVEVDAPPELEGIREDANWLLEPARTQVLRVVKEALVNVRKHSGAGSVAVTIRPDHAGVEVAVVDDGVGIDTGGVRAAPGHRGLATMRERVEMGGGWTQIVGGPSGTSLTFWMPRSRDGDRWSR